MITTKTKLLLILFLSMSIFNLFGQKKPTSDPYWEYDQAVHFQAKLNTAEYYTSSGFDFAWFVLEPMSEYIGDLKGELKKGKTLSYGQKALYYWWYVDAQVTNGGFTQFYFNDYGKYVPTIINAMKYIGDENMAELVNRSYEIYLKENKKIKDARLGGMEAFSNLYKEITDFDELDNEYYEINEVTMKNIENYIRKNPNEFGVDENGKTFETDFSGELKTFYTGEIIKEIIPLSKGVISGTYQSFYSNGKTKEIIHYLNGEATGEREEFYESGIPKHSAKIDTDKKLLEHKIYHENGQLKKLEFKTIQDDKRIGEYKEWYENGQLAESGTYISGNERGGEWLEFYNNGNKKVEAEFKDRKFILHNCWSENGTQTLTNGTGIYIFEYSYWEDDLIRNENEYKDYQRNGKQYTYKNGIISLYQEMENGDEHGITRNYDEDGKLTEETIYENGVKKSSKIIK